MLIHEQLMAAVGSHRGTAAADRLCEASVDLLHVDGAAISLIFDGVNSGTLGASSPAAREFDEIQFVLGVGPCLESVMRQSPVLVPDLADESEGRWPTYAAAMLGRNICSVFALPVVVAGEYVGALDLYRDEPSSLDADEMSGALIAAEFARVPLLDLLAADLHLAALDPTSAAWTELRTLSRFEVSQATGMLVGQLDVDPAEALIRLRAHAYATNRSATDVARDIIDHRLRLQEDR